jgi:hypothetical protein
MHILMGFLFSFTWSKLLFENMVGACHQKSVVTKQGKN